MEWNMQIGGLRFYGKLPIKVLTKNMTSIVENKEIYTEDTPVVKEDHRAITAKEIPFLINCKFKETIYPLYALKSTTLGDFCIVLDLKLNLKGKPFLLKTNQKVLKNHESKTFKEVGFNIGDGFAVYPQ
jgi:hypothetical protein